MQEPVEHGRNGRCIAEYLAPQTSIRPGSAHIAAEFGRPDCDITDPLRQFLPRSCQKLSGWICNFTEEAARANLEDYRFGETPESDSWHIRAKGGRDRLLPVPTELADWVRAHHRIGPTLAGTPLFTNPDSYGGDGDGRWTKSARRRAMLKAMTAIGKPGAWSPNESLRHCYGTRTAERLLRDGNRQHDAIRIIMTIMGHTSAETSQRYIQLATESLREGIE
ncbi:MAG TPA: hypothetical protein EYG46_17445 [Myxococcales bacterium]|nr:hypothetical protein [Myxococcales bacterium]HIM02764.1 hypothetical protein [Myxococcales bacterium]